MSKPTPNERYFVIYNNILTSMVCQKHQEWNGEFAFIDHRGCPIPVECVNIIGRVGDVGLNILQEIKEELKNE